MRHPEPTKIARLAGLMVVVGALSWLITWFWEHRGNDLPTVPWSAPIVLAFLAAVVASITVALRVRFAALRDHNPAAKLVDPLFAARALGIAKASALVGAIVAGIYGGYAAFLARDLSLDTRRERAIVSLIATLAAIALAAAGVWLERVLRVPPEEDERKRAADLADRG